jgi:hypothetical protein
MQGTPRLQHYVPQFLLKQFARPDGKLWAYDTENRKMFRASPRGLAAEGYFYGPTTEHATPQATAVETFLADKVDGPGADALSVLLAKRTLSSTQAFAFFYFVAAQMLRTPASLQRAADYSTPILQETVARIAKLEPTFRKNAIANVKASGATDSELAQFVQILDEGKFTVTPTREFTLVSTLSAIEIAAQALAEMRWTFLDLYPTDSDLLLGDHPVTMEDVGPASTSPMPLGIRNQNIEIAMPLSLRMVALAHWDGPVDYGQLVPGTAGMLNERTLRHVRRFAFTSYESGELLERAIALRKTAPKFVMRQIRLGEKLIISPEFW